MFNKENDITYIGQGIGYTQGIGMSYEVDFDTFTELVNKLFKNAKLKKAESNNSQIHDDTLPDNIHFKSPEEKEKKKKEEPKHNNEAVPTEE